MKLIVLFLMLMSSITYGQQIQGNTVKVDDVKKQISISASVIPAKENSSWSTDKPISAKWEVRYENKTYHILFNGTKVYSSNEIEGIRSYYKSYMLKLI